MRQSLTKSNQNWSWKEERLCCLLKKRSRSKFVTTLGPKFWQSLRFPSIIGQFSELDPGDIIWKLKTLSTKTGLDHHKNSSYAVNPLFPLVLSSIKYKVNRVWSLNFLSDENISLESSNEKTLGRRLYYFPTESRIGCVVNLVWVLIKLLGQTKQTVSNSTIRPSMEDIKNQRRSGSANWI